MLINLIVGIRLLFAYLLMLKAGHVVFGNNICAGDHQRWYCVSTLCGSDGATSWGEIPIEAPRAPPTAAPFTTRLTHRLSIPRPIFDYIVYWGSNLLLILTPQITWNCPSSAICAWSVLQLVMLTELAVKRSLLWNHRDFRHLISTSESWSWSWSIHPGYFLWVWGVEANSNMVSSFVMSKYQWQSYIWRSVSRWDRRRKMVERRSVSSRQRACQVELWVYDLFLLAPSSRAFASMSILMLGYQRNCSSH